MNAQKEGAMSALQRSWVLLISVLRLLRRNPKLLLFPLMSGTCLTVLLVATMGGGITYLVASSGIQQGNVVFELLDRGGWPAYVGAVLALLVIYVVCTFLTIFFNAALVGCVLRRLEGRPATVCDGLRLAWSRRGAIFGWAMLYAAVGLLLSVLEERARAVPFLGRLLVWTAGAAWSVAVYLMVPVVIFEDLKGFKSRLARSAQLFSRTWGEQVAGRLGAGAAIAMVTLAGVILLGLGAMGLAELLDEKHFMSVLGGTVLVLILMLAVAALASSALNGIYTAVLYSYAVTGMLPDEFSAEALPRRRRS
jgi:hypothetical protein